MSFNCTNLRRPHGSICIYWYHSVKSLFKIKYTSYNEPLLLLHIEHKMREFWLPFFIVFYNWWELYLYTYVTTYQYASLSLSLSIHPPFSEYFSERHIRVLWIILKCKLETLIVSCSVNSLNIFWPNWFYAYNSRAITK